MSIVHCESDSTFFVTIGGKEFSLRGDDEEKLESIHRDLWARSSNLWSSWMANE